MKKLIQLITILVILFSFYSCKKDSTPGGRSTSRSNLSFKYNGNQYSLTYTTEGVQGWGAGEGNLYINQPDIFGGIIRFPVPNCAYMEPYEGAVYITGDCQLTYTSGMPVDSVVVYTYESGSLELSYTNCETKKGYDIFTGTNYTYRICDGNGKFSLVLKNKEDKRITITNGVIKIFNQIR